MSKKEPTTRAQEQGSRRELWRARGGPPAGHRRTATGRIGARRRYAPRTWRCCCACWRGSFEALRDRPRLSKADGDARVRFLAVHQEGQIELLEDAVDTLEQMMGE